MKQIPWRTLLLIFGFFLIVSVGYFTPAHFEGRVLYQQDVAGASGNGSDVRESGTHSYWTNSLFGGMPMYQISPSYPSTEPLQYIQDVLTLRKPVSILGTYPWLIFALLAGFYIFMRSLRISPLPAVLGSVMWALSSYFIILIQAGHIWKLTALCFVPPAIAGVVWCYRGKYLLGGSLFAFFMALQLLANHVQMTYYFALLMLILVIAYLVQAVREHRLPGFLRSTGILAAAGLLAVAANSSNLYHTYQYAQETMRGGSELTATAASAEAGAETQVNANGLSKDYITQWSYGIGETWTLMIPNAKGGKTEAIATAYPDRLYDTPPEYRQAVGQMNAYWGNQPFTSGPVYAGAFVVILFLVGCVVVKGSLKWGLLSATLLSVLLSWGKNFMPLTDFFIDYFPLYDKFRAVSSILVIAELTIPTLAVLGVAELIRRPEWFRNKWVWAACGIPVVLLLLFALLPNLFFQFLSVREGEMFAQMIGQDARYLAVQNALEGIRRQIFRADVYRSLVVILSGAAVMYLFARKKLSATWMCILLVGITLVDLWQVDKRYLSDKDFIRPERVARQAAPKTAADEEILRDTSPGYRVLNTTVNTFNDATTSRWHRSVGGYHAAKLQRYQDLIDHQLLKGNRQVYNMLNTKYVITQDPATGAPRAVLNPEAFGAAWFADDLLWVDNADQEMAALNTADLRKTAVVDKRFASVLPQTISADTAGHRSIEVTRYTPNTVCYKLKTEKPGVAVLSDIYYPHGWQAAIDGQQVPIARANYVLRAVAVPQGEHTLQLTFSPQSIRTTEGIAFTALCLTLLCLLYALLEPWLPACLRNRKTVASPRQTNQPQA